MAALDIRGMPESARVYRRDASVGRDAAQVFRTKDFNLPLRRRRDGSYALPAGRHVYACMTSDFFLPEADAWRAEAWHCIRARPDVSFSIITKRIVRAAECLPPDWGAGYENVEIGVTCKNRAAQASAWRCFCACRFAAALLFASRCWGR